MLIKYFYLFLFFFLLLLDDEDDDDLGGEGKHRLSDELVSLFDSCICYELELDKSTIGWNRALVTIIDQMIVLSLTRVTFYRCQMPIKLFPNEFGSIHVS